VDSDAFGAAEPPGDLRDAPGELARVLPFQGGVGELRRGARGKERGLDAPLEREQRMQESQRPMLQRSAQRSADDARSIAKKSQRGPRAGLLEARTQPPAGSDRERPPEPFGPERLLMCRTEIEHAPQAPGLGVSLWSPGVAIWARLNGRETGA